jgi:hypothetical protein
MERKEKPKGRSTLLRPFGFFPYFTGKRYA